MLSMLIPTKGDWNAHGPAKQAEAFWKIVRALPADEHLPPMLWRRICPPGCIRAQMTGFSVQSDLAA